MKIAICFVATILSSGLAEQPRGREQVVSGTFVDIYTVRPTARPTQPIPGALIDYRVNPPQFRTVERAAAPLPDYRMKAPQPVSTAAAEAEWRRLLEVRSPGKPAEEISREAAESFPFADNAVTTETDANGTVTFKTSVTRKAPVMEIRRPERRNNSEFLNSFTRTLRYLSDTFPGELFPRTVERR